MPVTTATVLHKMTCPTAPSRVMSCRGTMHWISVHAQVDRPNAGLHLAHGCCLTLQNNSRSPWIEFCQKHTSSTVCCIHQPMHCGPCCQASQQACLRNPQKRSKIETTNTAPFPKATPKCFSVVCAPLGIAQRVLAFTHPRWHVNTPQYHCLMHRDSI